jgi:hypothetical protein
MITRAASLLAGKSSLPNGPGWEHIRRPGVRLPNGPGWEDQVRQRALAVLAEEIRLMLDEGLVAAPEDIDLCMIIGRRLAVPPGRDHALPGPFRHRRKGHRLRFGPV